MSNPKLSAFKKRIGRKRSTRDYLSKGSIRRLARRGGVGRISGLVYDEVRDILRLYLKRVIRDSIIYCDYFKRKTVTAEDVIHALQNQGKRLYGFDSAPFPVSVRTSVRLTADTEASSCSSTNVSSSSATTSSLGLQLSPATKSDEETE